MSYIDVFDSWESIIKAREAKGLGKWKKLESIAGFLEGKKAEHITFTCSHPSHGGAEVRHVLGSTTGNLHFLMGYGNPGFALAPYHWLIIDPNLDEKEVKSFQHPSRPEFWKASGLDVTAEGDLADGKPHPNAKKTLDSSDRKKKLQQEAVRASNGYREYLGVPSLGLVFGLSNNQVYRWDLVKDSFFAVTNPDFTQAMSIAEEEDSEEVEKSVLTDFDDNVYPVVKSFFPRPGSAIPLATKSTRLYGLVTTNSIEFCDKDGNPASVLLFDTVCKSLDLVVNGKTHPEIISNLAVNILNIPIQEASDLSVIKGSPTEGFDKIPSTQQSAVANRNVIVVDGHTRVIPE